MGGGSIRAAAKAAMIGGYRSAAVRRAVLPVSSAPQPAPAGAGAGEGRKAASTFAVVDDWVILDREVFGPVPTHEEAMAATLDLKEAFQLAKTESHVAQSESLSYGDPDVPKKVAQVTVLQDVVHPESQGLVHSDTQGLVQLGTSQDLVHLETPLVLVHSELSPDQSYSKTCEHEDKHDSSLASSGASERVVQAFTMLHESPETQDVVASLACDTNVWNAVMRNEKVMKYYKTYETKLSEDEVEGTGESGYAQNGSEPATASAGEAFMDYVEKMKALVSEMVTNLSSIMQDLVATSNEGQSKGKVKIMTMYSQKDFATAPSAFVVLAIASIMVVLLKRA
ncbi:uncharacterized protein LOC102707381 [Oryza brachyantha]|uniref:Uncharacterized protein n=1 Tax=Oryza brachyantha TaxID=4533 RepID=J3LL30_ORYBR|nr:uncharacterized protein LOC102707381 [Oryza brachyantha]